MYLLVIGEPYFDDYSMHGANLYSEGDTTFISLYLPLAKLPEKEVKFAAGVLLHEALHHVLRGDRRFSRIGEYTEDGLGDYFAHAGLMAQKLGLVKKKSPDLLFSEARKYRKYAADGSRKLLTAQ